MTTFLSVAILYASNLPPYIMNLLGNAVTHPCLLNPCLDTENHVEVTLQVMNTPMRKQPKMSYNPIRCHRKQTTSS